MSQTETLRTDVCEKHGPFEASHIFGQIWTLCPACTEEAKPRQAKAAPVRAEDRSREKLLASLRFAGVVPRFLDRSLDNYRVENPGQRAALDFAREYAASFGTNEALGRGALFLGAIGTGKTHLAVGIARHVLASGRNRVLYTTVQRAVRRVKETWSRDAKETESEAIADLVAPDLLVLDEVGVQFGSDTERHIMFDVLNERYERRRSTIFISNLSLPEVTSFLGERVIDRMREDGGGIVSFGWESYRGR